MEAVDKDIPDLALSKDFGVLSGLISLNMYKGSLGFQAF